MPVRGWRTLWAWRNHDDVRPHVSDAARVKDLFHVARDLPAAERTRWLASECAGDARLRNRVEALLVADAGAGRFLAAPTAGAGVRVEDDAEYIRLQRTLSGRFSIDREIGRGGMGVVYLARDVALNRAVAIKLLPLEMAIRSDHRARFLSEVRTAASMTHPNIVPIHLVEEQGDVVCFVMSYVEGETLRQRVERLGPLSSGDAVRTMQEVAWALAHAHDRGIVHRDVKPDNILIERASGRALVTDFGIAATLEAGAALTTDGVFLGTPLFTSPEQVAGVSIDRRSDLYSLGATIFFALTGRPVFDTTSAAAALEQHLREPPPPVGSLRPDIPRALAEAVDRCLAKDPAQRFQSAEDLAKVLGAEVATVPEMPEPIRRVLQETIQVTADVGGLLTFAILGIAGWWLDQLTANEFLSGLMTFVLIVTLIVGGMFLGIRIFEAVAESRDALAKGYSAPRIRRAMLEGTRLQQRLRSTGRPAIALSGLTLATAVCWWWNYYSPIPDAPGLGDDAVWIGATFGPLLLGRFAIRHTLLHDGIGSGAMRRINVWLSGLILRAAAWRVPRHSNLDAIGAPTEAILVGSADALLAELPTAFRETLSGLPDLMRRLGKHAEALRTRRSDIERALAEAGAYDQVGRNAAAAGDAGSLLRARLESARLALADAHQRAGARLADVIAALESVRLGLLRLRAGVAVPADLTADLELAWQVGEQVDALLVGFVEVEDHRNAGTP